jgi:hypothetical protein
MTGMPSRPRDMALMSPSMAEPRPSMSQSGVVEAESIHIIREVAAEFERPVLLFSGDKDSIGCCVSRRRRSGRRRSRSR